MHASGALHEPAAEDQLNSNGREPVSGPVSQCNVCVSGPRGSRMSGFASSHLSLHRGTAAVVGPEAVAMLSSKGFPAKAS